MHAGETLHEAVIREVSEETGLQVAVDRFLGWVERMDDALPLREPTWAVLGPDALLTAYVGGGT